MKSAEISLAPASQNELQAMAYTDPLTGLGNRYRMRDRRACFPSSARAILRPLPLALPILIPSSRSTTSSVSIAGDEILCQVAHRLKGLHSRRRNGHPP